MAAWNRVYREHELWDWVQGALEYLDEFETDDEDQREHADHLELVFKLLYARKDVPTPLISVTTLDELQQKVQEFHQVIRGGTLNHTWVSTNVHGQRVNVSGLFPVDSIVRLFSLWPDDRLQSVRSAATVLQHATTKLEEKTEFFQEEWNSLEQAIKEKVAEYDESIDNRLVGIREEMQEVTDKVEASATIINAFEEKSENALEEHRAAQGASLTALKQQLELTLKNTNDRTDNTIKSNTASVEDFISKQTALNETFSTEQQALAKELFVELNRIKDETAKVASLVSTTVVHDAHHKEANQQRKQADYWRTTAIALLIAAVVAAYTLVSELTEDTPSDYVLMVRFSITFTIGLIALYCIRESARHRKDEREARSMELTLRSLSPFIENHPKKDIIMEGAAYQLFHIDRNDSKKEKKGFWD